VSRIKNKNIAAANSHATIDMDSGAIAIPRIANVEITRRSAIEDITSHTVGRSSSRWLRPRMAYVEAWLP
jgi:hypothetical protein